MFGSRRHRPPNPPLTAATANPNAATAAAAVFKRHESNNSLSAAAAAAALRARPTTPTRVADVQTKRTLQRSASVASTGTASDRVQDQSSLRRRGSSGSMTERTFRTPSPHRPGSSGSAQRRSQSFGDDMPPVPALPRNMDTATGPSRGIQPETLQRKANSVVLGTAPVRLASQKLASGEAPSWFGAAKLGDLGNVRRTDPAMASPPSSPLQLLAREDDLPEGARPASQASSINFSYPTRTRRGSANTVPTADQSAATHMSGHAGQAQPLVQDQQPSQATRAKDQARAQATARSPSNPAASISLGQSLVYDPNSRRMVPQADLLAVQQAVINAAQAPTRPKKKKRTPQRAGSHLAAGTMGRAKIDIANPAPAAKIVPSGEAPQVQPSQKVQPTPPMETAPAQETRMDVGEAVDDAAITSPRIEAKRLEQPLAQQATERPRSSIAPVVSDTTQFAVRRQPSVVREEPEPEEVGDERETQKVISDALDAVPGRQRMQPGVLPDTHLSTSPTFKSTVSPSSFSEDPSAVRVVQKPKTGSVDVSEDGKPKPGLTEHGRAAHVSRDRTHSNSPARQAHFGPVQDTLVVKHSPPPRSISPRKSAMKHTSSPRGASPSDDTSEASGNVKQEPPVARKKSVRVSFDDGANVASGDSTSANQDDSALPAGPLHANRHSWLANLGRGQDLPSLDDDVVMKPRPALPSFGSVRDRKPRETSPDQTERPLVRPKGETRYPSTLLPSPPLGSSTDRALGAVLSKEQARLKDRTEHTKDTSRHGEPLPPVVTSVEGSGYFSDTSDNSSILSSEFEQPEALLSTTGPEPRPEVTAGSQAPVPKAPVNGSAVGPSREVVPAATTMEQEASPEPHIPAISVSQPTPLGAENKPLGQSVMDVPGGFPEDESDQSATSAAKRSGQAITVSEPAEATQHGNQPTQPAVETAQPTVAEDSSDSDSEVYSDAYEDLSEIEGDGFQSLDAVVDSPLQQSPRPSSHTEQASRGAAAHESAEESPKLQTQMSSATTAVETPPAESPQDEWERAKAYWRSLTAEKRAQLEKEALEEAGLDADKDEAETQTDLRKQKTVERAALAVHKAQKASAQQEQERARNPDRSYMIKPGEQWAGEGERDVPPMRKTMRDKTQNEAVVNPAEGSRLRKSMRANAPSAASSHDPPVPGVRAVSKRLVSSPSGAATLTKPKHRRSATQAEPISREADSVRPLMPRRGSTGSESSFKRSRSAKAQGTGFRNSLRPTSPPSTQGDRPSSKRLSLRTLSPAGSDSRQNGGSQLASTSASPQMRTTLRDQTSGRKSSGGIRIPSFSLSYGGGKKSGSKTAGNKGSGSRFSSRFADSSDEEGPGGFSSGFRSRFEDSSDDEPVMPIPVPLPQSTSAPYATTRGAGHHLRKESSIASTALPEELEEDSEETHEHGGPTTAETKSGLPSLAADTNIRRTRSGRGQLPGSLTAPLLSRAAENNNNNININDKRGSRRNSFLSVLRHRKKDSSAGKIGRPEITESAARRDTKLERSVGQLERIRSRGGEEGEGEGEEEEAVIPSPKSPRLQKRGSQRASSSSAAGIVASRTTPEVGMSVPPPTSAVCAAGGGNDVFLGDREDELDAFVPAQLKRSSTSGNLGTRTLSGGFLHLAPQRRVSSMGLEPPAGVEGSVAGSMAGASSTTRRKRFGALRRILGIND